MFETDLIEEFGEVGFLYTEFRIRYGIASTHGL